jgi:hypothetical protein
LPEDADAGLRWRDGVGACTREAPAAPAAEGVGVVEARAAPAAEGGGVGALSPLSMLRRNETKQQQKKKKKYLGEQDTYPQCASTLANLSAPVPWGPAKEQGLVLFSLVNKN